MKGLTLMKVDNLFIEVWNRIIENEGNTFKTKTGIEFNYQICKDGLITSRTTYRLSKSDFKKAFDIMPIDAPGKINSIVRGPAYIWAILNDERIYIEI